MFYFIAYNILNNYQSQQSQQQYYDQIYECNIKWYCSSTFCFVGFISLLSYKTQTLLLLSLIKTQYEGKYWGGNDPICNELGLHIWRWQKVWAVHEWYDKQT